MIDVAERALRIAAAVAAAGVFGGSGIAAVRGSSRPAGDASGLARRFGALGTYLLAATLYTAMCVVLWRPLPVRPSPALRAVMLGIGSVGVAGGLGVYAWGRRALGEMYNVSSVLGSELYAGHRLVTTGPYRFVRHPMYSGLLAGALGALLLYRRWTFVFVLAAFPGAVLKARREDRLLAGATGVAFEQYGAGVPGWFPRLRKRRPADRPASRRAA